MSSFQQPSGRLRPFRPSPFGRYTLLAPLTMGGMGELFLGRLEGAHGFEKLCVIKRIIGNLSSDPEVLERFLTEAKTVARLSHGSVAQVLDLGIHEKAPYLVLEHVDGKDLRRVIGRARERTLPLPLTFILYVMGRVLDALAYVHRKRGDDDKELGLVHRDISPQNILVSYEGEVKVIDFGLAKSALNPTLTHPSIILGKFLYMSPEQARHTAVDRRSDLYSVGLCLYELISGRNPFEDVPPTELLAKVTQPNIPSLHTVDPLFPPDVVEMVRKALAADPAGRFQTAEEFGTAVRSALFQIDPNVGPESISRFMRESFSSEYAAERRQLASFREVRLRPVEGSRDETAGGQTRPGPTLSPSKGLRRPSPVAPLPPISDADFSPETTAPGTKTERSTRTPGSALSWDAPPGQLEATVVAPAPRRPVALSTHLEPLTEASLPWADAEDVPSRDGDPVTPSVVVDDANSHENTQPRVVLGTLLDESPTQSGAPALTMPGKATSSSDGELTVQTHAPPPRSTAKTAEVSTAGRIVKIAVLVVVLVAAVVAAITFAVRSFDSSERRGETPMEPVVRAPPPVLPPVAKESAEDSAAGEESAPSDSRQSPVVIPPIDADEDDELAPLTAGKKGAAAKKLVKPKKGRGRYPQISAEWDRVAALLTTLRANGQNCDTLGNLCPRIEKLRAEVVESAENVEIQERVLRNIRGVLVDLDRHGKGLH